MLPLRSCSSGIGTPSRLPPRRTATRSRVLSVMNDERHKQEVTLSETITGRLAIVCADFDAAWQSALKGGSKPALDTYLSDISGPDRVTLQEELERISQKYEQRLCPESEPSADATIETGGATQVV